MKEQLTLSGNSGEWSEIYVFLKLLADGKLYAADANLNKLPNIFYPIIRILRNVEQSDYEYYRNGVIKVIRSSNQQVITEIPIDKFVQKSLILFKEIKNNSGSFTCGEIESFLKILNIEKIKAGSLDKKDITLVVHDVVVGMEKTLGFSIKSQVGHASTLINAGKTTNFIYRVEKAARDYIADVNSLYNSKGNLSVKDRVKKICNERKKLVFCNMASLTFKRNLQLIDSLLPDILAELLILFYRGEGTTVRELTEAVAIKNPCRFDLSESHAFYEYKIKNFLTDAALGMRPANIWSGMYDATGGFIVVKDDGEILCYHIYNRNEFQEYLYQNTKLETASTSRHEFGEIFEKDGELFINLNLQVRFIR